MTTWMTPVGVALIVGGITTLIVFRAALFRTVRRNRRVAEAGLRASTDVESWTADLRAGLADASFDGGDSGPSGGSGGGRHGAAGRTVEASVAGSAGGTGDAGDTRAAGTVGTTGAAGFAGVRTAERSERASRTESGARTGGRRAAGRPARPAHRALRQVAEVGSGPVATEAALPEPRTNRRRRRAAARPPGLPAAHHLRDSRPHVEAAAGPTLATEPAHAFERSVLERAVDPVHEAEPSHAFPSPGLEPPDPELPSLELSDLELSDRELSGLRPPGTDDLHTGNLRTGYAADQDADLSAPFGTVDGVPVGAWTSAESTSTFAGFFDETPPADPDATDVVPITEVATAPRQPRRSEPRYGDRIEGWVRPQYQDQPEPVAGEYWTPVPGGSYETEYGWPVPVERLREVPLDPPPAGPAAPVEAEARPTAPAPQWPPARPDDRIESPRSWSDQVEAGTAFRTSGHREEPTDPQVAADYPADDPAGPPPVAEDGLDPYVHEDEPRTDDIGRPAGAGHDTPAGDTGVGWAAPGFDVPIWTVPDRPAAAKPDFTWSPEDDDRRPYRSPGSGPAGAFSGDEVHRAPPPREYPYPEPMRARPRPQPRPGAGRPESRSTVYVSRHAGGPG